MGISSSVVRRASPENPSTSLANPASWLVDWAGGGTTKAGTAISEANSMSISGVWAAVRLLANAVAMTPAITYRRLPTRGKERAVDQVAHQLLHERPNPEMTPFTFKQVIQAHAVIWGGGYAEIELNGASRPIALWPLLPHQVAPERVNGRKVYRITLPNGEVDYLGSDRVMHVVGLSYDGVLGHRLMKFARESLGLTKAIEEFGAGFFGSGARLSGVLETDQVLSDKSRENIKASWDRMHTGLSNAHRTAFLEAGMKWHQIGLSPEDGQNLETRRFQVSEVARWLGVPPHMIGDLEHATFTNVEHQGQEFVNYALGPWLAQWEQTASHDLIAEGDRREYFVEFLREALLRGDTAARGEFYQKLYGVGGIAPNDIAERENMNPVEGGDRRFVPMNMIPLDRVDEFAAGLNRAAAEGRTVEVTEEGLKIGAAADIRSLPAPKAAAPGLPAPRRPATTDQFRRLQEAQRPVFEDAARRMLGAEVNAVRRALRKSVGARDAAAFRTWCDEYYSTRDAAWTQAFAPIFTMGGSLVHAFVLADSEAMDALSPSPAVGQAVIDAFAPRFAARNVAASLAEIRAVLLVADPDDVEAALEQRMGEWEAERSAQLAVVEVARFTAALAGAAYGAAGLVEMAVAIGREASARSVEAVRETAQAFRADLEAAGRDIFGLEIDEGLAALDRAFGERDAEDFAAWIDRFYSSHPEYITGRSKRLILGMADAIHRQIAADFDGDPALTPEIREFAEAYTTAMGEREVGSSVAQLREILANTSADEVEEALRERFGEWKAKRAAKFARRNAAQAENALARKSYMAFEVERIAWVTHSDNCSLCNMMSGKTVAITSSFLGKGETVDPGDGKTQPLTTTHLVRHPPLHDGCDCSIAPA